MIINSKAETNEEESN